MTSNFSILSLCAIAFYFGVAILCGKAALTGIRHDLPRRDAVRWLALAVFFCVLAAMRYFHIEDRLEALLRHQLMVDGEYKVRRDIQGPVAAAAIIVIAGMCVLAARAMPKARQRKSARALGWARLGAIAMTGLVGLRLISLHSVDELLYHGPRLNWVIDIGATVLVGWAALRYATLVVQQKRAGSRHRR